MKLEVLGTNLNQSLAIVSRSVANRVQLPILSNILLVATKQGLEVVSTDLEMSFRVKVGARVEEEGRVTVPAKAFTELAGTLGSVTVSLETEGESLKVEAGSVKARFQVMAADEYPTVPQLKGEPDLKLDSGRLISSLNRVVIAASRDDSRPVFTGVLWRFGDNLLTLVATDGFRLGRTNLSLSAKEKLEDRSDLIIPARALLELSRVVGKDQSEQLQFKIDRVGQQVIFKVGEVELVSRLLGGDFPAFEQIIPSESQIKVRLNRDELTEAVRRASIFARDAANLIKLKFAEGKVVISATSNQLGSNETSLDAEIEGEGLETAFNGRYLLDYLAIVPEDEFVFESNGSLKPGVFKNEAFDFLHIIMPVRVQG